MPAPSASPASPARAAGLGSTWTTLPATSLPRDVVAVLDAIVPGQALATGEGVHVPFDVLADAASLRDQVFVSVEVVEAWSDKPANQLFLSAGLLTEGLYFRDRPFGAWEQANAGLSLQIVTLRE